MFSFVKERKAEAALSAIVGGLEGVVSSASPVERAAAVAVANAMLIAGSKQWGREFSHAPMKLSREIASDAVSVLADHHAKLEMAASALSGRAASDPQISCCRWEIVATQVVMITAGASFGKLYADAARSAWRTLSSARIHADEAVAAMLYHSKAYSTPPVPACGRKTDRDGLLALASTLPPMFRKKKA